MINILIIDERFSSFALIEEIIFNDRCQCYKTFLFALKVDSFILKHQTRQALTVNTLAFVHIGNHEEKYINNPDTTKCQSLNISSLSLVFSTSKLESVSVEVILRLD